MRQYLTLSALALALAACDTSAPGLDPEPAPAGAQSRHWEQWEATQAEQAEGRLLSLPLGSVGVILTFRSGVDPEEGSEELFSTYAVKSRAYYRDGIKAASGSVAVLDLPRFLLDVLLDPNVLFVEPDLAILAPVTRATDIWVPPAGQTLPWNLAVNGAATSSALSGNGSGTVDVDVYVIDTDVDHPELNVVERVSFLGGKAPARPDHGTHIAGIIGARDDARGIVGIAPGARIHALEVVDASGAIPMTRLIRAVEYVTAQKRAHPERPMVVNFSIGSYTGTTASNALDDAVQASIDAGVTYVVSAGNTRQDAARVSPARVPGALTVGSYGAAFRFSSGFSNFGSVIDLLAPGERVVSTVGGGRYGYLDGTSMAAPHVTGAAALYLAQHPTATPSEVRTAVLGALRPDVIQGTRDGTPPHSVGLGGL